MRIILPIVALAGGGVALFLALTQIDRGIDGSVTPERCGVPRGLRVAGGEGVLLGEAMSVTPPMSDGEKTRVDVRVTYAGRSTTDPARQMDERIEVFVPPEEARGLTAGGCLAMNAMDWSEAIWRSDMTSTLADPRWFTHIREWRPHDACGMRPRLGIASGYWAGDAAATGVASRVEHDAFGNKGVYEISRVDVRVGGADDEEHLFVPPGIAREVVEGSCVWALGQETFFACGGGCDAAGFVTHVLFVSE